MPIGASKRKARQRSAQDQDDSPGTSFQRLDTEKSRLTEEEISEITQQIGSKIPRKVRNAIRRAENTILKALSSLSEISLHVDTTSTGVGTALGEGVDSPD